jgi:hypothetical protein
MMNTQFGLRKIAAILLCLPLVAVIGCGGGVEDEQPKSSSSGGGSSGSGSAGSPADALNYAQVNYSFSCKGLTNTITVQVSNGPCISSQKAYARATTCNEYDSNMTFNSVGKPFYQCLVTNSTGSYRTYYQQYLRFYGG